VDIASRCSPVTELETEWGTYDSGGGCLLNRWFWRLVLKGSTSFGACEVRCWRWLVGNKILVSLEADAA